MDTIFAQATAPGRAGVSVIRISGPAAFEAATVLAGSLPPDHRSGVRKIMTPEGQLLDHALVLPFARPASFTGEDVVELHLHGSIAVVQAVIEALSGLADLRLAEPGEFTRRALENEKLDLAQVEGLADLIDAETEAQRRQALRVFSGHLGGLVENWRSSIIRAAALLEATIDFADEEVPVDVTPEVLSLLQKVASEIEGEIEGSRISERIRSGFEVAIVGPPNAGKSTLMNALAGRDAAITSEYAGTTRDIVEVRMNLAGLPVTLLDTAGLRDTSDPVEQIGIERAIARAVDADLRIFLKNDDDELPVAILEDDIVVAPKGDLLNGRAGSVSGVTGLGIDELFKRVENILERRVGSAGIATHARHRFAMKRALDGLTVVLNVLPSGSLQYDIASEELRFAIRSLESVVGRIDVENLLDEIFSSFCIGK